MTTNLFDALLREFEQRGVDVDAEELCDALWLARSGIVTGAAEINLPEPLEVPGHQQPEQPDRPKRRPAPPRTRQNVSPPSSSGGDIHALGAGSSHSQIRGTPISLGNAPTISQTVELDRSLRNLRRKRTLRNVVEIDEEATAAAISETGLWQVTTRPVQGRWLDVALVIEQSPSMRLWQDTALQFRSLLERAAGLRSLKTFFLRSGEARLELFTTGGRKVSFHAVHGTGPQHRVLFVSDAMSSGWLTAEIPRLLTFWACRHPTTLIQVLPAHMWSRTALQHCELERLSNSSAAKAAQGHPIRQISVTAIDPQMLFEFARSAAGAPRAQIVAFRADWEPFRVVSRELMSKQKPFDLRAVKPEHIDEVYTRFEQNASESARKLARRLASSPLVLPVMRLIQHTLVTDAVPSQLAEIFYSGMLYRHSPHAAGEPHANQIEYEFLPGLRERFLNAGGIGCAFDTLRVLSNYLTENFGRGDQFMAIVSGTGREAEKWHSVADSPQLRPFGRIAIFVMQRLGIKANASNEDAVGDSDIALDNRAEIDAGGADLGTFNSDLATSPSQDADSFGQEAKPSEDRTSEFMTEVIEKLAQAIHEHRSEERMQSGELRPDISWHQSWDELAEIYKNSNRISANNICISIAQYGMKIVSRDDPLPAVDLLTNAEIENAAKLEHDQWMAERKAAGWKYSEKRDVAAKLHPMLKPWEEMPAVDKDIERKLARVYPSIIARAGYKLVRIESPTLPDDSISVTPGSVYISYNRGDAHIFARRLYTDLTSAGFDIYSDGTSIPPMGMQADQAVREVIARSDRLLLVIGPGAASSESVRQEWQFAWSEAGKPITPILRLGDFSLIPDELKLLHCEDFRDDSQYAVHFANLVRQLSEPLPILGKLIAVPSLPPHQVLQAERLIALRQSVLSSMDTPNPFGGTAERKGFHGLVETSNRVGIHGMGGIGKSVLATALAHDRQVRAAFPDGIIWISLGPQPDLVSLMDRVHRDLGGDGAFATEAEGKERLQQLLADRAVLLVLDDAVRRSDVDAFDVLGERCKAVVTTRDSGLLSALGGTQQAVELLTDAEALRLLAATVGQSVSELPSEALQVVRECGRLPLAIALAGGLVANGTPWSDVHQALRDHEIEFLSDNQLPEQHQDLWKMIEVSVMTLGADAQARLVELAVFPEDSAVPDGVIATLWESTGGLSELESSRLLADLSRRSLLHRVESSATGTGRFNSMHDLVRDYCVRRAEMLYGQSSTLHDKLLDAYRARCPAGWWQGPHDGYFFTHLRDHLIAAGRAGELADLLMELPWLEAKNDIGLLFDLPYDYLWAIEALPANDHRRTILKLLDTALRREIHWINPHRKDEAEGLFPSIANLAWWYDCPESLSIYGPDYQPPSRPGPKLYELMERWRREKVSAHPTFQWAWPSQPPDVPLASPLNAVLQTGIGRITSLAFSPDGQQIASGSIDNVVRVWDAISGEELAVLRGHTGPVADVAYSSDGRLIVSAANDTSVRLWDAASFVERARFLGHERGVDSVAFSPGGSRIASGSSDNTVRLWDAATGAELAMFRGGEQRVQRVTFSPDGQNIVSVSSDRTVRVWNAWNGQVLSEVRGQKDSQICIAISPDARHIATGAADNSVRVYDAVSGAELVRLRGHDRIVQCVAFSSDGRRIVSGASDKTVRLWDAESGAVLAVLKGHELGVASVAPSPDGRQLISGGEDGKILMWTVEDIR